MLLSTSSAMYTAASSFQVSRISHFDSRLASPLIQFSSSSLGEVSLQNSTFYSNNIGDSAIMFSSLVGKISFKDNTFTNDIIRSTNHYIVVEGPYSMEFANNTFSGIDHDGSSRDVTLILQIKTIDISLEGVFVIQDILISTCSIQAMSIATISKQTESLKTITFQNITVKDNVFTTLNSMFSIGPIMTEQNIKFEMIGLTFSNINFVYKGNLIYIEVQTREPIVMDSCTFENIVGGSIRLKPFSTSLTTPPVSMAITNITVIDSDFKESTFFALIQHCLVTVADSTFNKNSGYFRGAIISIAEKDVTVTFTHCYFNNNVGMRGSIFYVNGDSRIIVENSKMTGNFAILASIGYISKQGVLELNNCEIFSNNAQSVGLLEFLDSINPSKIRNSEIYDIGMVEKDSIINELSDPSICFSLCFASTGYIDFLNNNIKNLDILKEKVLFSGIEGSLDITDNTKLFNMSDISISKFVTSTMSLINITVTNIEIQRYLIFNFQSHVEINTVTFTNIRRMNDAEPHILRIEGYSSSNVTDSLFEDIDFGVFSVFYSPINIVNSLVTNVIAPNYMFLSYKSRSIATNHFTMYNSSTTDKKSMFYFKNSTITSIRNTNFTDTQPAIAEFDNAHLEEFDGNLMNGTNKGFIFRRGSTGVFTNSTITNLVQNFKEGDIYVQDLKYKGGAIETDNAEVDVRNCTFSNNQAVSGGAIFIG